MQRVCVALILKVLLLLANPIKEIANVRFERNFARPWISDHSENHGFDLNRRHLQQFLIIVLKNDYCLTLMGEFRL